MPLHNERLVPASAKLRRRCVGRRGAALVEAAIALPLLFLILFGIIDFGSLFNDYLSVRQGTREAARQAAVATNPTSPGGGAWNSTNCTVTSNITIGTDGYDLICYAKDRLGLNEANTRVSVEFTPQSSAPLYAAGQGVVVCTQYPASSLTGFLSSIMSGYALTSKVEIRIEQSSTTFTSPVQETPLPGTSWPANCSTP